MPVDETAAPPAQYGFRDFRFPHRGACSQEFGAAIVEVLFILTTFDNHMTLSNFHRHRPPVGTRG